MIQTIKNFFKGLFDSEGSVSSKRVSGMICMCLVAAAVIVRLSGGIALDNYMWEGLLFFAAICFGLNTFLTAKSMSIKSDVASDIVDKSPEPDTADDAKDVLNSNKP